jgi:hypothetical protein
MRHSKMSFRAGLFFLIVAAGSGAESQPLSTYFPPAEERGGWRTLLPESGEPDAQQKVQIRKLTGCDWDKFAEAWQHNASAPGATGLLVIRKGHLVGNGIAAAIGRKRLTSTPAASPTRTPAASPTRATALGLTLADFGNGPLPSGKTLTLDTKVCNAEWIPESLPLSDPRKESIRQAPLSARPARR